MNENYLIWGTVESIVSAYEKAGDDDVLIPDIASQAIVRRMLVANVKFFSDNGLLNVAPYDDAGNFIDREYRKNDLTTEGLVLCQRKLSAWLKSKAAKKDPPDMKLLEKELAAIRAGK